MPIPIPMPSPALMPAPPAGLRAAAAVMASAAE